MKTTPEVAKRPKLTPERRWELWELAGILRENGITPDTHPHFADNVWEIAPKYGGEDLTVEETDDFLDMWRDYEIHELVRVVYRLRSELFSKLRHSIPYTFGEHKPMTGPQALQYPEIEQADALLRKYPEVVRFWNW